MSQPHSILVLGAGELGIEVLRSLAAHPQRGPIRLAVLVRPGSSRTQPGTEEDPARRARDSLLRAWSIERIAGDVSSDPPETLAALFAPFHTLIGCVGMGAPGGLQLRIARAALAAGVRRYFPWQFGIDYDAIGRGAAQDLFDSQIDVRDLLRAQGATRWCVVSTGMFISFLFEPAFGVVDAERRVVTAIGGWESEITVTGPRDIGRITAELAIAHPEVEGPVRVAGDTISMGRLAGVVERVMGRGVERRVKTVAELKGELEEDPGDDMRKYRVVFAQGTGVAWSKADSFNGVTGIATQTVEEWARENLR